MKILVDTSVWIDYFRSGINSNDLDYLIDENLILTNDLILTELLPFLRHRDQASIIQAITKIASIPLSIDWLEIQEFQLNCLNSGINGIGIPDLIIAQNARQNDSYIFSLDKHFGLLQNVLNIKIYS